MRKHKPRNVAVSVHDRLLRLAKERMEEFHFVLTRYALERLLYRLSQSPHRDVFVLKGAMLFALWSDRRHRPTKDLDLLGQGDTSVGRCAAFPRGLQPGSPGRRPDPPAGYPPR